MQEFLNDMAKWIAITLEEERRETNENTIKIQN